MVRGQRRRYDDMVAAPEQAPDERRKRDGDGEVEPDHLSLESCVGDLPRESRQVCGGANAVGQGAIAGGLGVGGPASDVGLIGADLHEHRVHAAYLVDVGREL